MWRRSLPWRVSSLVVLSLCPLAGSMAAEIRTPEMFRSWRDRNEAAVAAFETFLRDENLAALAPLDSLLRSASSWQDCNAEPFSVPPADRWPAVRSVLQLLRQLRERGVLGSFEVHSSYRDEALNKCSGGARGSAHLVSYAIDLTPAQQPADGDALCLFWRDEGSAWRMGLSRYPSGRIHIDTSGHRTWGSDGTSRTSYCLIKPDTPSS